MLILIISRINNNSYYKINSNNNNGTIIRTKRIYKICQLRSTIHALHANTYKCIYKKKTNP